MLAGVISLEEGFGNVTREDVRIAIEELSKASQGMLHSNGDQIFVRGAIEELRRRVAEITGTVGEPRRRGVFRTRPD
jgi:hypothetical protein